MRQRSTRETGDNVGDNRLAPWAARAACMASGPIASKASDDISVAEGTGDDESRNEVGGSNGANAASRVDDDDGACVC